MTVMRKWIALLLLAVLLPATAFAQACNTRCTLPQQAAAAHAALTQADMQDHCAKKTTQRNDVCPLAAMCDFANLFVLNVASTQFTAIPPSVTPTTLLADFVSVTYPPALRPPAL